MSPANDRRASVRKLLLATGFVVGLVVIPVAFAFSPGAGSLTGTLVARHSDDFVRGRSSIEYVVRTDGRLVPVRGVSADQAARLLGKPVKATTRADGTAELVAADGTTGGTSTGATAAVAAQKRVAVILMNFSNDTRQPWTTDQVRANAFDDPAKSVAAYYRQASWGTAAAVRRGLRLVHDPRHERELQLHGLGRLGERRRSGRRSQPVGFRQHRLRVPVHRVMRLERPRLSAGDAVMAQQRRHEPAHDGARAGPQLRGPTTPAP